MLTLSSMAGAVISIGWILYPTLAYGEAGHESRTFKIAPHLPPCEFRIDTQYQEDSGWVVKQIIVSPKDAGGVEQYLAASAMSPVFDKEDIYFDHEDINFDGYQDLVLLTDRGAANSYGDYWLFKPTLKKYVKLGHYPFFQINTETHRISTYERMGHGGLIYEIKEYIFLNSVLTTVRTEKQEWIAEKECYFKVIQERSNNKLQVVSEIFVPPPK